jgi:diguanylate cyclase (GGDEF)-like protein
MTSTLARIAEAAQRSLRGLQPTDRLDSEAVEHWRTQFVVQIFCTIGLVFLLVLAINNVTSGRPVIAAIDLALAVIALVNVLALRRTGDHARAKYITSGLLLFLYFWLLTTGGVEGTGPMWCYVFVIMLMFVHGLREGTILLGAVFAATAVVLLAPVPVPWMASYPEALMGRFLPSLLALIIMAILYEYSRERAQRHMAWMSARMTRAAHTDSLTELPNRRYMTERIGAAQERLEQGEPYTLIEADLDGFKSVNDRYGHDAGDRLLAVIAERLASGIRDQDVLGRWGGEEFLVLLPGTRADEARTVAERLRERVSRHPVTVSGQRIPLTVSIGLSEAVRGDSRDAILRRTDGFMYAAKQAGGDRIVAVSDDA